jgi:hypothetical protein
VNRFRVKWRNDTGDDLRATYWVRGGKPVLIEYLTKSGIWISWDSKSGVLLGAVPPEVDKALEGDPQPITSQPIIFAPQAASVSTNVSTL